MFQEQRNSARVSMRAQVICIVDSRTTRGVTWNLSRTGIQVENSSVKPKEVVRLSFRLPVSGVAIEAVGTVLWEHNRLSRPRARAFSTGKPEKRREQAQKKRGTTRGTKVEQNRREQGEIRDIRVHLNH